MSAPRTVRCLSVTVIALFASAIGIQNAFAQWTYRAAPQPLIRNISVFTNNPVTGTNTLIVSTLTDGMYKGTDNGANTTWQKINTGIPVVQARAHVAITPVLSTNPVTDIYAVTDGAGVFKTTNGGTSWTAINGSGPSALGCLQARTIAVPVTTVPRTLLVSTSCRNNSGLYQSIDDGANWTRLGPAAGMLNSLPGDVQSSALGRSGTGATALFLLATTNYGIFKSTDGGTTWATANVGIPGTNVFSTSFSGAAGTADLLAYVHGSGVYRSVDTGGTWVPSNVGLPTNPAALAGLSRESGQILYIGLDQAGVYKTVNGGLNWTAWGNTANDGSASYTRSINPGGSAGRYYLATINGVTKTSDNGVTLQQLDISTGGRINAITHDRDRPYVAYVALHFPIKINYIYGDYNSNALITPINNGVTGTTNDGVVYQDRLTPATLYISTNNRGIFKSTNSGAAFTAINNGLPSMIGQANRLAIDHTNSQILYLGLRDAAGVYKSVDGGANWVSSSVGLSSPLALSINLVTVDGNNPAIVWVTTDAGLFKSTNSGASWTLMYSAVDGVGSALPVGIVRVRPGNSNEIYITNNHSNANGTLTASSGILKSTDGGTNWTNILPNQQASQVRVTTSGDIYAGVSAQVGNPAVYLSTNGGTSFAPYSTNLQGSDIRTFGFAADDSALISLSLENGFYTNDAVPVPPTAALSQTITEAPNVFQNLVFPPQTLATTSASKSVTITNTGTTSAIIVGFDTGNNAFAVQSSNCVGTLAPGASCTINVTVTPNVGADGSGSGGTLSVVGNFPSIAINMFSYGASPTLPTARLLQFPGAVPAYPEWYSMGLNFRELSFGNQTIGTSRTLSYTLKNFGGGILNINPITVDNARYVLGGTCGATLAAGASCLVSFTYTPTAVGTDLGNVNITTDSAFLTAGRLNFSLTGVGEAAGAEGSLITTFGDGGRTFISTGPYGQELVVSLAHQADGKTLALILGRKIVEDGISIPVVARLNTDGTLDGTFGTGGIVRLPATGAFPFTVGSTVFAVANGKILVTLNVDNATATANDTYVYRLLPNGQIDTTFGTAGSTLVPNLSHGVRLAPDGKIVLGGLDSTQAGNNALIFTRLTVDGAIDTSFGTNGRTDVFLLDAVQFGQGSTHLEVASDGKILFSYSYGVGAARDIAIYRLTASGVQDTTWGTAGRVNVSPTNREDNLRITRQQSDGKILLLTRTARAAFPANFEFLLARLNADGTIDSSFGSGGIVETLVGPVDANGRDFASGLQVLADGKIVVSGRSNCNCATGQDAVVMRYLSNGTLDSSFGVGGIKTVVLSRVTDSAHALDIDADGTIVIGGDIAYQDSDRGTTALPALVGTAHVIKLKNTLGVALVNLTVGKVGTGTVTSSPAGIDCGGTCVASVAPGAMLILTATPSMGSTFVGWSDAGCPGTGICSVTVNMATTITATFSGGPVTLLAVQSRKTHVAAGTFDLSVDSTIGISGAVTVESRTIGAGHTIVFQFSGLVTSVGGVSSVDAGSVAVGAASFAIAGNDVVVTLTGVSDNRRTTIAVTNVNGTAFSPSAAMGFLVGDVNNTRSVNSSDISSVKARSGQTTTALNFKFDVNASGAVNSSDISAVKARSGLTLPP